MTSVLQGKVAFITGASGGIGAAIARSLSAAGVKVGLASRRGDDLGLLDSYGLACDVSDPDEVDASVAVPVERLLTALVGRELTTLDELTGAMDEVRAAVAAQALPTGV